MKKFIFTEGLILMIEKRMMKYYLSVTFKGLLHLNSDSLLITVITRGKTGNYVLSEHTTMYKLVRKNSNLNMIISNVLREHRAC